MIILSPMAFVRSGMRKPYVADVVEIEAFPVKCHNGCGTFYTATLTGAESLCPDCGEEPKPWRVGAAERIETTVRTQFGNTNAVEFRKTLGSVAINGVARRALGTPPAAVSMATVSAAEKNQWP